MHCGYGPTVEPVAIHDVLGASVMVWLDIVVSEDADRGPGKMTDGLALRLSRAQTSMTVTASFDGIERR